MENKELGPGEKAIAEGLFESADGIFRIPTPTGYPVGDINLYFIDGAIPTLIDAGMSGPQTNHMLETALAHIGRKIGDIRRILLTHAHVDHSANARALAEATGANVYAHSRSVRRLADVTGTFEADFQELRDFLRISGFDKGSIASHEALTRSMIRTLPSCPGISPLDDGDVVDLGGGQTLTVHHRPGHSSSDAVYLMTDRNLAFTGDHVLPHITSNPVLEAPEPGDTAPRMALVEYRTSLDATASMNLDLALPGHGVPFDHVMERCEKIIRHQDKRIAAVFRLIKDNPGSTYRQLADAMFGFYQQWDALLTLSEIVGAIQLLENRKEVVVDRSGEHYITNIS